MEDTLECNSWSTNNENLMESQYPLHRACRDGDLQALSVLLSADTELYEEDGFYGWTPIHWAAHFGKLSCLMRLIEHGCHCDYPTQRFNQAPLHVAAQNGKGHCLKWLLHCGAAINRQDYMGETPIHKAARVGNMECVSLLISQGAKLTIRNHSGQTPSQLAADNGRQECAAYIERALQIADTQGVNIPTSFPSSNFLSLEQSNSRVVDRGQGMEEDHVMPNGCMMEEHAKNIDMEEDDMDTDLSTIPNGCQFSSSSGIKRSREHCEEEECKKSRRDEPLDWKNQNFHSPLNGFMCHQKDQNNTHHHQQNGINHPLNKNLHNGISFMSNGFCPVKNQNGFLQASAELACINNNIPQSTCSMEPNHIHESTSSMGHNSIQYTTSSMEHYHSITQEQGYNSLLVETFENQYDGS